MAGHQSAPFPSQGSIGVLGAAGQSTMSNLPPGSVVGASTSDPVPAAEVTEQADVEGTSESLVAGDAAAGSAGNNVGRGLLPQLAPLPLVSNVSSATVVAAAAAGTTVNVAEQPGTRGGGARRIPRSSANSEVSAHNCVLAKAAYGGVVTEHLQSRQLGRLYDQWREERRAQHGEEDEGTGGRNRGTRYRAASETAMALSRGSGPSCNSSCANSSSSSLILRPPSPVLEATSTGQSSSRWGPTPQEIEEAAAFETDVVEAVRAGTMAQKMQEQGAPLEEITKIWQRSYLTLHQLLGPDDPETLIAASRATTCLEAEGRLAEARSIYRQIVEGRRRLSAAGKQQDETLSANLRAFIAKVEDIEASSNGELRDDVEFTRSERLATVLTNHKVGCVSFADKASDWGSRPLPSFIEEYKPLQLMKLHKGPWRPLSD